LLTTAIARINRFNAGHPWSHNDLYLRWVLRQLPGRLSRTIDVGCGTGGLVRLLSARADRAEGIDVSQQVIDVARRQAAAYPSARFEVRDLLTVAGDGQYDAVTAVAVVHHLPLAAALTRMRGLLAPGGRIVIVGCYRQATVPDHVTGLAAVPANMIMGWLKSARAAEARLSMSAPTAAPQLTLAEIRQVAAQVLPGARIRRRLFWRYSLAYRAPAAPAVNPARPRLPAAVTACCCDRLRPRPATGHERLAVNPPAVSRLRRRRGRYRQTG
jgi:SAM-dependent methyltransferase